MTETYDIEIDGEVYSVIIDEVEDVLLPNRLCSYLFELSQVFNRFYDQVPVLKASLQAST